MSRSFSVDYDTEYDTAKAVYSVDDMVTSLHLGNITWEMSQSIATCLRENSSVNATTSTCDGWENISYSPETNMFTHVSDDHANMRGGVFKWKLDNDLRLAMGTEFQALADKQHIFGTKRVE